MFWSKKKEIKEKQKMLKLKVMFKNSEKYKLIILNNSTNRTVLNELANWFYKRKSPTHFLEILNNDDTYGVEYVVFNREEICMMSLEKFEA